MTYESSISASYFTNELTVAQRHDFLKVIQLMRGKVGTEPDFQSPTLVPSGMPLVINSEVGNIVCIKR